MVSGKGNPGSGRTIVALVGGIVALLALCLVVAGASLLWVDGKRDADGYFATGPHRFETPTFAIASDGLEVVADAPRWLLDENRLGTIRIRATGADRPLFMGVARAADVRRYLGDVPHEIATEVGTEPFDVQYRQAIGSAPPERPAGQDFWVSSATVDGTGSVVWNVRPGAWSVVVMNADGSADVTADLELGARVGFLLPAGIGLTVGGGVLLLAAGAAVYFGLRRNSGSAPPQAHVEPPGAGRTTSSASRSAWGA